jgi:hypothetical protein
LARVLSKVKLSDVYLYRYEESEALYILADLYASNIPNTLLPYSILLYIAYG